MAAPFSLIPMETIFSHRSIRRYLPDAVDDALLQKILEAGTRASNTGNMQVYSIVVTRDAALRRKLWEAHMRQDMVLEAPVVMTFCADVHRFSAWCEMNDATPDYHNFLWLYTASIDAVLAAQNVALEAEANGLGICYLGTTNYAPEEIIDILQLPRGVMPVTTLVMGYPAQTPPLTDRLPLAAVVHDETYQDYTDDTLRVLYARLESSEETKRLLALHGKQKIAQVFTDLRYASDGNRAASAACLKALVRQGFLPG